MFTKPSLIVWRSLHHMVRMQTWGPIGDFLNDELQATYEKMVGCSDATSIHELRGRAKFISELQKMCLETGSTLEKLEK